MSKIRAIAFLLLCAPVPAFAATQPLVVFAGSDCNPTGATTSTSIGGALSKVADQGIIYVRPGTYTEHLTIDSKTVTIKGRAQDCTSGVQYNLSPVAGPVDPTVETVIDGGGNGTVFTLNNFVRLNLSDVRITHGYTSGDGGGISFTGGGGLNLTRTIVENNTANHGGGIAVVPTFPLSAPIDVNIWDGTLIQNNGATSDSSSSFDGAGGGVFLDSQVNSSSDTDVRFFMTHPNTSIFNNGAKFYGGGLYVGRKVEADIGSPGYFGYFGTPTYAYAGAIENNYATYGAGISLDKGNVRLYSTHAHEPVRIAGNHGPGKGGGIFATVQSHICGWGYSINRNGAYQGAAIWADGDSGVDLIKGDLNQCNPGMNIAEDGTPINNPQHFVDCAVGDICNEINSNATEPTDPASGAPLGIIHIIGAGSSFKAERLQIRGNYRTAVLSAEASAGASLENCLIAGNYAYSTNSSESLVWANTALTVKGCTVAGNVIPSSTQIVFAISNGSLTLTNSIVAQPTATLAGYDTASTATISDVISETNDSNVINGTNVSRSTPLFVDPMYGNYYLKPTSQPTSLGIDYTANCTPGTDTDLFGNLRGVPTISGKSATPCDIGAYERQKGPAAVTFPYNENFDELDPFAAEVPAGWVNTVTKVDPILVSTTPGWGSTTASPYLGPMAMHAIEPAYVSDSTLETPPFTIVSSGVVTFWHQFDLKDGYGGVALDISLDGGLTYNDILDPAAPGKFLSGGYSSPALQTGCGSPSLAGKPAWTGDSAGYQKVVLLLPAAANKKSVMLRWHLGSDCSGQHNGYWFDSLHVEPNDTIFANGFN